VQGWLDTVLAYPVDHIRPLVQFKYYADPHHPYMFHCHILEHEDMGMMGSPSWWKRARSLRR